MGRRRGGDGGDERRRRRGVKAMGESGDGVGALASREGGKQFVPDPDRIGRGETWGVGGRRRGVGGVDKGSGGAGWAGPFGRLGARVDGQLGQRAQRGGGSLFFVSACFLFLFLLFIFLFCFISFYST